MQHRQMNEPPSDPGALDDEPASPPDVLACPTCTRPVAVALEDRPASFPFCSVRCRQRDLGAWIDGKHVIPGTPLALTAADEDGLT